MADAPGAGSAVGDGPAVGDGADGGVVAGLGRAVGCSYVSASRSSWTVSRPVKRNRTMPDATTTPRKAYSWPAPDRKKRQHGQDRGDPVDEQDRLGMAETEVEQPVVDVAAIRGERRRSGWPAAGR